MLHDCHIRSSIYQCPRAGRVPNQGGTKRADRDVSEYDEEVVDEEQDWSDLDDTTGYDDFDLPWA